ncbi:MAG: hypothetical protein EBT07_15700, partial [Actinobacteria bacterium]|nr:hypothetical protein [Actinomycetota bacterium]
LSQEFQGVSGVIQAGSHINLGNQDSFGRINDPNDSECTLFGALDDIRIYNRALSLAEVGQFYQQEAGSLDSDGDGLTDAWERGYGRYQIISGNFTWEQAKADAEARGGHLATITSGAESDFIFQLFGSTLGDSSARPGPLANHTWLGASDAASEGTWRWANGESWSYASWGPGEPGNGTVANFLTLFNGSSNGHVPGVTWNDDQNTATEQYRYLLEFGYPTDPTKSDTDGDGFDDKVESLAGTDPGMG